MTIYQAKNIHGDLILEGSILQIQSILPAGSRVMSESEKKKAGVKELADAYKTMDARIIIIKIKQTNSNGI